MNLRLIDKTPIWDQGASHLHSDNHFDLFFLNHYFHGSKDILSVIVANTICENLAQSRSVKSLAIYSFTKIDSLSVHAAIPGLYIFTTCEH